MHAGIYYPTNSLKEKLCLRGNNSIFEHCEKFDLPFFKCGKFIVAQTEEEAEYLQNMYSKLKTNIEYEQIAKLQFLTSATAMKMEPNLKAKYVLHSPNTGILQVHPFLSSLTYLIEKDGIGDIVYKTRVKRIEQTSNGYNLIVSYPNGECAVKTKYVVNCAGLYAHLIAKMLMQKHFPHEKYQQYFARGQYFQYSKRNIFSRLIYPVPEKNLAVWAYNLNLCRD